MMVKQYELSVAEKDGSLSYAGSTYSSDNDSITDGLSRQGLRVVTFGPVLRNKLFPLPEIMELLLDMGTWGMGTPIEIEFAVNMSVPRGKPKEFGLLQMRPLVINREVEELNVEGYDEDSLICQSSQVLGNGIIDDLYDIVVVDHHLFDRAKSRDVAKEVGLFNSKLLNAERPYLLIGVGRWGSLDPWLGIPVHWEHISGARAIIETGFKEMPVTPSQGSHFFQNITSFMIGYFTVNQHNKQGFINWDWLLAQEPVETMKYTKLLHFEEPIRIKMNGHHGKGVIIKPGIKEI